MPRDSDDVIVSLVGDEPYGTAFRTDQTHDSHDIYHVETIHDNLVEYSEWWHCKTCGVDFIREGMSVFERPESV